jgi:hypothetical protein
MRLMPLTLFISSRTAPIDVVAIVIHAFVAAAASSARLPSTPEDYCEHDTDQGQPGSVRPTHSSLVFQ